MDCLQIGMSANVFYVVLGATVLLNLLYIAAGVSAIALAVDRCVYR